MRKTFFFRLGLIGLVMTLTACTSVSVLLPSPVVELPVVNGQSWKLYTSAGSYGGRKIELVKDAASRPPNLNGGEMSNEVGLAINGGVGIQQNWQVGYRVGVPGTGLFDVKYQILGPSLSESAKDGEITFAVYGRLGTTVSGERSGDQAVPFGPGGFPWTARATVAISGAGASLGYYVQPNLLLYGGYSANSYSAKATINQSLSDDQSSAGGSYEKSESGTASTAAIGGMWGDDWRLNINLGATTFHWPGAAGNPDYRGTAEVHCLF